MRHIRTQCHYARLKRNEIVPESCCAALCQAISADFSDAGILGYFMIDFADFFG
jgi:hypothetical protein